MHSLGELIAFITEWFCLALVSSDRGSSGLASRVLLMNTQRKTAIG